MASLISSPHGALSSAREAVRLLDAVLCGAAYGPAGDGFTFSTSVTGHVLDRITLWFKAVPAPPPVSPCPLAAAQREAVELLMALMGRVQAIRPRASTWVDLRFTPGAVLFDRLMIWGSAVEDLEAMCEDDEDGADAEPPGHPPDGLTDLEITVPQGMAGLVRDLYDVFPSPAPEAFGRGAVPAPAAEPWRPIGPPPGDARSTVTTPFR